MNFVAKNMIAGHPLPTNQDIVAVFAKIPPRLVGKPVNIVLALDVATHSALRIQALGKKISVAVDALAFTVARPSHLYVQPARRNFMSPHRRFVRVGTFAVGLADISVGHRIMTNASVVAPQDISIEATASATSAIAENIVRVVVTRIGICVFCS